MRGLILTGILWCLAWPAAGQRLASVNWCADRLLARMAPEQVVSVTWLMDTMPGSAADRARLPEGVAINHGTLEELLAIRPDVVVTGSWGTPALSQWLPRWGIAVWPLADPKTPDDMVALWQSWSERLRGHPPAWLPAWEARRAALTARARALARQAPVRVLWVTPGGWLETGGLVSAWLADLGWEDAALTVYGPGWHKLDLEAAARMEVSLRVSAENAWPRPALATAWLEHPVLKRAGQVPYVRLPAGSTGCPLPEWLDALERLIDVVEKQRG